MRKLMIGIVAVALLIPGHAWAFNFDGDPYDCDSWGQRFRTDYFGATASNGKPINIVNLRMRPSVGSQSFESPTAVANLTEPGNYDWFLFAPENLFVVLAPKVPTYDGGDIQFDLRWPGTRSSDHFYLDWMEGYYADDGAVKSYQCGSLWFNGSSWTGASVPSDWCENGTYYDAPPPATPEPATWVLLAATGLVGAIRRRRRS